MRKLIWWLTFFALILTACAPRQLATPVPVAAMTVSSATRLATNLAISRPTPTAALRLTATETPTVIPSATPTGTPSTTPTMAPTATLTPIPRFIWKGDFDKNGLADFNSLASCEDGYTHCDPSWNFPGGIGEVIDDPTGHGMGKVFRGQHQGEAPIEKSTGESNLRIHPGRWFPFLPGAYSESVDVYLYGDIQPLPTKTSTEHWFSILSDFTYWEGVRPGDIKASSDVLTIFVVPDDRGGFMLTTRAFDHKHASLPEWRRRNPGAPKFTLNRWHNIRIDVSQDRKVALFQDGQLVETTVIPSDMQLGIMRTHAGIYGGTFENVTMLHDNHQLYSYGSGALSTPTPGPVFAWNSDFDHSGLDNFYHYPDAAGPDWGHSDTYRGGTGQLVADPTDSGRGLVFSAHHEGLTPVDQDGEVWNLVAPNAWFPFQEGPYSAAVDVYVESDIKSGTLGLGEGRTYFVLLSGYDTARAMDRKPTHRAFFVSLLADGESYLLALRAFDENGNSLGGSSCVYYPSPPHLAWDRWATIRVDVNRDRKMYLFQDNVPVCEGDLPTTTRLGLVGGHAGLDTGPLDNLTVLNDNLRFVVYP